MKIIKPPQKFNPFEEKGISIFLAGSIEMGAVEEWQIAVQQRFNNYDVTFLNPRRDVWDSSQEQSINNPYFVEQVNWELDALDNCSYIFMYFDPNTISPISLLELGTHSSDGNMVVCCPDGYFRKGNVEIFCDRYHIKLDNTFEEALNTLKNICEQFDAPQTPQIASKKRDIVQVKNPRTGRYIKIDRDKGQIVAHKKSPGKYQNIPVTRKRKRKIL